jgi:hypothetical protein
VNKVVRRVDALQRLVQRGGVQYVALSDLGRFFDEGPELVRVAGQAAERHLLPFEQRDQATADVAGGAGDEGDGCILVLRVRHRS